MIINAGISGTERTTAQCEKIENRKCLSEADVNHPKSINMTNI